MSEDTHQDLVLDGLFETARAQDLRPSDALMARIMADAQTQQAARLEKSAPENARIGWLGQILRAIGGWPAMAGLATATVAGVWIGVYPTTYVSDVLAQYSGSDSDAYLVDLLPTYGLDLNEG